MAAEVALREGKAKDAAEHLKSMLARCVFFWGGGVCVGVCDLEKGSCRGSKQKVMAMLAR
jgi:hypothetical protein